MAATLLMLVLCIMQTWCKMGYIEVAFVILRQCIWFRIVAQRILEFAVLDEAPNLSGKILLWINPGLASDDPIIVRQLLKGSTDLTTQ